MSPTLFAFSLGREWRISLAELFSVFGKSTYIQHNESIAIFRISMSDTDMRRIFQTLGGSLRVIRILGECTKDTFHTDVLRYMGEYIDANSLHTGHKIDFALAGYGTTMDILERAMRIKKTLVKAGVSVRVVNTTSENINAASYKKEKLSKTWLEYSYIEMTPAHTEWRMKNEEYVHGWVHTPLISNPWYLIPNIYIGATLACQDIDAYAKRDMAKARDMVVGMMPPKLCQMMIHIAIGARRGGNTLGTYTLYDPFCGLGSMLIEWANMWLSKVFGSDISADMVDASDKSIREFIKTEKVWHERIIAAGGTPRKDISRFNAHIFRLDVKHIEEAYTTPHHVPKNTDTILVSEGYLGEIMRPGDISLQRVQAERMKLEKMYDAFFRGLYNANFKGNICISFPFWNMHGTLSFFTEIYAILEKYEFDTQQIVPTDLDILTQKGTLLYRRADQLVGREIWCGRRR